MAALPVPVLAPAVILTTDLHDFKYSDLFKATEDEIVQLHAWCQNNGLIAKDNTCAFCGSPTALRERDADKNKGFYFRFRSNTGACTNHIESVWQKAKQ